MRRYCPICDGAIKSGSFCKTCKTFVKVKTDKASYYLNESHKDTRAHNATCDYHINDSKYDAKPTYTINQNNTRYNSNASNYTPQTKRYTNTTQPVRSYNYTGKSNTTNNKKSFIAVVILCIVIYVFATAFFAIFSAFKEGEFGNFVAESDDLSKPEYEYDEDSDGMLEHDEVLKNGYKCSLEHYTVTLSDILESDFMKHNGITNNSQYFYEYNYGEFLDMEEYANQFILKKYCYCYNTSNVDIMFYFDVDSVTEELHEFDVYGFDNDLIIQGVIEVLNVGELWASNDEIDKVKNAMETEAEGEAELACGGSLDWKKDDSGDLYVNFVH